MSKIVFLFESDKSQNNGVKWFFVFHCHTSRCREPEKVKRCLVDVLNFFFLQRWLERTPGLEKDGFDFWGRYKRSVKHMLDAMREEAEVGEVLFRNHFKNKRPHETTH